MASAESNIISKIIMLQTREKGKLMLGNLKKWTDKKGIAIDPEIHPELITEMRIATSDEEMNLNKDDYTMDLLDSLRLLIF